MVKSLSIGTKLAVGYERVSTTEQAGPRHSSLETQESRIAAYCESRRLHLLASYRDIASGRRDDRGEYRRMVEFVSEGGAEVIVVQFLDRFGRNPKEILTRIWELQSFGVSVEATDEDIQEELILLIKAGIAGQESRRISERVRANMDRAVARGVQASGLVPPQYQFSGSLYPSSPRMFCRWLVVIPSSNSMENRLSWKNCLSRPNFSKPA